MRILVSAIACHPHWGSEAHVGWSVVKALAPRHELTVLTHVAAVPDLQAACREQPSLAKVRFVGIGKKTEWHPNRLLARLQSWWLYTSWCREARQAALDLTRSEHYDVGHHVTYATWRQASPLSGIDIPWVLGPVGGAEEIPRNFLNTLSASARLFELLRGMSTAVSKRSSRLRESLRSVSFVLASTPETRDLLAAMGVPAARMRIAPAIFMPDDRIKLFKSDRPKNHSPHLRIFAGGNLEGRKGLALALRALSRLRDRGVPFTFIFAGYGPELLHLKKLATKLSLHPPLVTFRDSLPLDEYRQAVHSSDVYLLPSLRESGGLTLGEAMLGGCVPVVVKAGGPGLLVNPDCGYAFEPDSPEHLVEQMTDTLQRLWQDADHWKLLSGNAVTRAETALSEERYLEAVEGAYRASVGA